MKSLSHLLAVAQDRAVPPDLRHCSLWAAIRLSRGKRIQRRLVALLSDPDAQLHLVAAETLAYAGDGRAVAQLIAVLAGDSDPEVRGAAAIALGLLGSRSTHAVLMQILGDQSVDPYVRGEAAEGLAYGLERSPRRGPAAAALRAALQDAAPVVRWHAVFALEHLGDVDVVPEIERVAETDRAVVPDLGEIAAEARSTVRAIRDRHVEELANELLAKRSDYDGLATIVRARKLDAARRAAAVRALGLLGDGRAIELLRALVKDTAEAPEVRKAALSSLARIAGAAAQGLRVPEGPTCEASGGPGVKP